MASVERIWRMGSGKVLTGSDGFWVGLIIIYLLSVFGSVCEVVFLKHDSRSFKRNSFYKQPFPGAITNNSRAVFRGWDIANSSSSVHMKEYVSCTLAS